MVFSSLSGQIKSITRILASLYPFILTGYFIVQLFSLLRGPITNYCKELFQILSPLLSVLHLYVTNNLLQSLFFWSIKEDKSPNAFLRYKGASLYRAIERDVVISPNFGWGISTNRSFPASAVSRVLRWGAFAPPSSPAQPALCSAQMCSELARGPCHGAPLSMTDVNILLMSRGGKNSPSSQLVFWSPAFTFPDMFLGEPELLLVVVLFCKSMSSLAD